MTNFYSKETFTGVYTNFSGFIPLEQKFDIITFVITLLLS